MKILFLTVFFSGAVLFAAEPAEALLKQNAKLKTELQKAEQQQRRTLRANEAMKRRIRILNKVRSMVDAGRKSDAAQLLKPKEPISKVLALVC